MILRPVKSLKIVSLICIIICIFLIYINITRKNTNQNSSPNLYQRNIILTRSEMKKGFTLNEMEEMSALGRWLISPEGSQPPNITNAKTTLHLILVWKYGAFLENRHIKRFSSQKFSPWANCPVQCLLSYNSNDLEQADAVIFHLHRIKNVDELPTRRNYNQRWIFLTDESPMHTFLYGSQKLSDYNKLFNWSMTYRMDSDIPVPYGRTVQSSSTLTTQSLIYKKLKKKRNFLQLWVAIVVAIIIVGIIKDCDKLEEYKFYLSFENSNCRQYLTEKVFWNAYEKFAIPVIMGASPYDCDQLLPPNSFLHVNNFSSPLSLAHYLKYLGQNNEYIKYHMWREQYKVINEHGYFGSSTQHYCRACEALHYNSLNRKVYNHLENFWNKSRDCVS